MRTVRNIVNTGRTIVCTIHQPSIDIFESFDELLLLKRGGQTIYAGRLSPWLHNARLTQLNVLISSMCVAAFSAPSVLLWPDHLCRQAFHSTECM